MTSISRWDETLAGCLDATVPMANEHVTRLSYPLIPGTEGGQAGGEGAEQAVQVRVGELVGRAGEVEFDTGDAPARTGTTRAPSAIRRSMTPWFSHWT